ncbi:hypothetical protein GJU40_18100 [Bacillus lacus]|uniref:Uncharacterized protein n=1 Tax=Metabacillus lacus TaxID=1983721 RepID=A0A7X2J3E8_9BACI|nr:hypothetical protein [Metabacillus lacus]MRX74038.1 hypothetical protein [Metabacillus lacus]
MHEDVKPFTVLPEKELKEQSIHHQNAGEVVLLGEKGYSMGNGFNKLSEPAKKLGNHGGDPARKELHAIFMGVGPDLPAGQKIDPVSLMDVAPTVYDMLDLKSPEFVEGKAIDYRMGKKD